MRKIFVDCGAWEGTSSKYWREQYGLEWDIYAFECNPIAIESLKKIGDIILIQSAVYKSNCNLSFTCGGEKYSEGSSACDTRTMRRFSGKQGHALKVDAIDFSEWIFQNTVAEDVVVVKMNIEGAEYDVVPRLVETGAIEHIDHLFIDWHCQKMDMHIGKHIEILESIPIPFSTWNLNRKGDLLWRNERKIEF